MRGLLLVMLAVLLTIAAVAAPDVSLAQQCSVHCSPVFSPGGQFLLVGAGEPLKSRWNLWDVPAGRIVTSIVPAADLKDKVHCEPVAASFCADGKTYATCFIFGDSRKVAVQVGREGRELWQFIGSEWTPDVDVQLSPDARFIYLQGLSWTPGQKETRSLACVAEVGQNPSHEVSGFRGWSEQNQLLCADGEAILARDPASLKVVQRWDNAYLEKTRTAFRVRSGSPEQEKYGPGGWAYLGKSGLGLRFEKRMGKGKAEIFIQKSNQVLASWPVLHGHCLNADQSILALVTSSGVVLVDLAQTEKRGQLVIL